MLRKKKRKKTKKKRKKEKKQRAQKGQNRVQGNQIRATSWKRAKKIIHHGGELTGDGAEVEVVPDDLLQLVVHRALLEAQVEVMPQVLIDHAPWRRKTEREGEESEGN